MDKNSCKTSFIKFYQVLSTLGHVWAGLQYL